MPEATLRGGATGDSIGRLQVSWRYGNVTGGPGRANGFEVDERRSDSLAAGLAEHRAEFMPDRVIATEPASRDGLALLRRLDVEVVATNQFLCHPDEFAAWAQGRKSFTMEHFYRWQRRRLGILMDGAEPAGGRWNFDAGPFTTLYWDFVARHADRFERNPRMVQQARAARKLNDLPAVRRRAVDVLEMLESGVL